MESLIDALLEGDRDRAVAETLALRESGADSETIVTDGLEAAMERLDHKCTAEEFNLLEIMLSGRAVMTVMDELFPAADSPAHAKGTVIVASLEGDVHDLGKNILKIVLTASGYRVVDEGKDCPVETLLDSVARETPLAVGISGLITTVVPKVRELRGRLAERGLKNVKLIAGGAALKQATAEELDVDFVAQTSFDGLRYVESTRREP